MVFKSITYKKNHPKLNTVQHNNCSVTDTGCPSVCSAAVQLQGQFCEVVGPGHAALLQDHGGPSQRGEGLPTL